MAIPFKPPEDRHHFRFKTESDALDAHFIKRELPEKSADRLLMASWNIANLGAQNRSPTALKIIAHVLGRFDLVAVQEVNEHYRTFAKLVDLIGGDYAFVMTDTAGNDERLAFVYDRAKVTPRQMFGELALRDWEFPKRDVTVKFRKAGKDQVEVFEDLKFRPFDRNPFIGTFAVGKFDFALVNCHLYFGGFGNSTNPKTRLKYARRVMEIHALAKWAARAADQKAAYDRDIILTGDMNVPRMEPGDSAYEALIEFGFQPLDFTSKIGGSNLGNDKTYDQMAFAPGGMQRRIKTYGVFDFDNAIFKPLWAKLEPGRTKVQTIRAFNAHVRYHISDHRPLWVQMDIT